MIISIIAAIGKNNELGKKERPALEFTGRHEAFSGNDKRKGSYYGSENI